MQGSLLANDLRKVISIVDLLRDIGLGAQLSLPKVIVLGTQSSGKSSLLEQIVGLDFLPRGVGVVTRRPLELRMNNVVNLAQPYAEFDQIVEKGVKKKFTNFNEVRTNIDLVTDQVCGKSKQIIDKPIILNIFSKSCPNLTIVDLPGITSIPVGEQPKDIYDITKNMAFRYIKQPRSIILCVMPANQDLSTSQALKILREIDPTGQRSIGCMTKIDIMNRGDDARKILKNQQIPLRYGYVGIKGRSQEDVNNNLTVEQSLKAEKKYFTTSPIYSTLSSDLFGTESLTKKLTSILYQQIKASMPDIFNEIKAKKKVSQEELQKLGPGVANTDAEMVNYAWKSIATFLKIFKNSITGIKSNEYNKDPISSEIRQELNGLYQDQFDDPATDDITDKDIQKTMINFPGQSTIPGFPSIDAFLAILNPLLKKLQNPAYAINNRVHQMLQTQALNIINEVLSTKYPEFNSRFRDLIKKILQKYHKSLQTYLSSLLECELFYLYTNDLQYLIGDFNKPQNDKQVKKANINPLIYELRKRIDAYYKLVVRNLRDLIPKQVFNFQLIKCIREMQFEAFQFTSDVDKLKQWLNEPAEIRNRRLECIKAIKVFDESEKKIRMDPDISKLIKITEQESKYYIKMGMKSPDQLREEEQKRKQQFFALTSKKSLTTQKKPDPPKQPPNNNPPQQPQPQPPNNKAPINNPPPVQNPNQNQNKNVVNPPSSQNPQNNFNNANNFPPQQPPNNNQPANNIDFANFFGKNTANEVKSPPSVNNPVQPTLVQPAQLPIKNNGPMVLPIQNNAPSTAKKDIDWFSANSNPVRQEPPINPLNNKGPVNPPPPVVVAAEQKKPQQKKKTFNKLFGI